MTRTPSQVGRYSSGKGKRAAREAVKLLQSFGFTAKNNPMHGVEGAADVLVVLTGEWRPVEVKHSTAIVPGRAAFDQAWQKCCDEADATPLMLFRWGRTWGLCTLDPYWMRAIYIGPEIKRRLIEFNEGHAFARPMVGTRVVKQPALPALSPQDARKGEALGQTASRDAAR